MKKIILGLVLAAFCFSSVPAFCLLSEPIEVAEVDGSPLDQPYRIVFPNGTLACTGGVCTYTPTAAGGALALTGGTMSGDILMDGNDITGAALLSGVTIAGSSLSIGTTLRFRGAYTVATIPVDPAAEDVIVITDGALVCDQTTGSGSSVNWFWYTGAAWVCMNSGIIDAIADPNADRIIFWDDSEGAHGVLAPDDSTVEINGTTLRVKDAGITAAKAAAVMKTDGATITLGNGSDAITTGAYYDKAIRVPFKCTLSKIVLTTDKNAGAITIDVWSDAPGATTGLLAIVDADSLFDTATEPAIADASSDAYFEVTTFDDGEAALAEGDYLVVNVDSATITRASVSFVFVRVD